MILRDIKRFLDQQKHQKNLKKLQGKMASKQQNWHYIYWRMISKTLKNRVFTSIEQFLIQKYTEPLGVGSFGTVRLAVHKFTDKTYAIKIICCDADFKENQISLLERQITIHYNLNHPCIVKLWDVIEENDKIYMIMEFAQKGNLYNFQSQYKNFSELESFKVFAQMLEAIEYLHKNNIFHRDIKPENILLDHEMNTKLCDFGWAAHDIGRKRSTFCGTYEYMAPQMINEEEYDFRIDIWALGVLLYELNHSAAPFPADSLQQMKVQISSGSYEISRNLSNQLKQLIKSILQFEMKDRPSIQDIKNNLWMQKMKKNILWKGKELKFDKKKSKNAYGSLGFTPAKHLSSKYGSTLFNESLTKKEMKLVKPQMKKPKMKKKCKTLEEEALEKLVNPLKSILVMHTQKQNDSLESINISKMKQKYKVLSKLNIQKSQLGYHKDIQSKLNLNKVCNFVLGDQDFKNFKTQEKNEGVSNRILQTNDSKKKRKRIV